jgi:hypothetical protein
MCLLIKEGKTLKVIRKVSILVMLVTSVIYSAFDKGTETTTETTTTTTSYLVVESPPTSAPVVTTTTTSAPLPTVKPSGNGEYILVEWEGDHAKIPSDKTKRCPQYEDDFAQHGLPVEIFSYISWRESRCTPTAQNLTRNSDGSSDHGLVQINSSWKTVTSEECNSKRGDLTVLLNVDCNLKVAKRLLETSSNPLGNWNL